MKHYVLPFKPIAWKRAIPNYYSRHMYDAQKQEKLLCGIYLRQQHGQDPFYEGALHLSATFFMAIPHAKSKKSGIMGSPHFIKPDLDNMEKFIQDCATGILYKDDCQIAQKTTKKIYDSTPRIEFTLQEIV